ncbi:MAG: hypothetical protein ACKVHP_01085 [Verrucomicrobiales bacterium]|jgi:hypothetical protein
MNTNTIFGNGPERLGSLGAPQTRAKSKPVTNDSSRPMRNGLATAFGESTKSEIDYTKFRRGFLAKPFSVGVAYYNDAEGASSMANYLGTPIPLRGGLVTTAKGAVDWGLKTPEADYLGGYLVDGKVILKGERGNRYAIVLRNNTRQPLEFVVSVDGLDVLDGNPASYSKRGYVVGPKRTIEVDGFRTSKSRVAAFRFGEVSDSYAALRHDHDRNVGVIGVAVFSEQGKNPWIISNELPRRKEADPFPAGRFAIPPH